MTDKPKRKNVRKKIGPNAPGQGRPRQYDHFLPKLRILDDLGMTDRAITQQLGIPKSTVNRLRQRLERDKWI